MEFRRFIKAGALFVLPLVAWMLLVVLVDPFDYFNVSHLFSERTKKENAASLNTLVFNMLKEKHSPSEDVIIGDSRAENLPLQYINKITGRDYLMLGANALKLNESIELFYYANKIKPIKRAVFTINFNEFNEYAYADRVTSVEAMARNPLLYMFDGNIAQAAFYVVKSSATKQNSISSVPPMSKDDFWNYIVTVRGKEHYGRYSYPDDLYQQMQELVAVAKPQGTEITFIIVPNESDFQSQVREFGLTDSYLRFKRDMSNLGVRVIDYDYLNAMTTNRANFLDPLHYNDAYGMMIAKEVFQGPLVNGRLLDQNWAAACSKFLF